MKQHSKNQDHTTADRNTPEWTARKNQDHAAQRPTISKMTDGSGKQPRLQVSSPDDTYEREADRVAKQVMRMDQEAKTSTNDTDRKIVNSGFRTGPLRFTDNVKRSGEGSAVAPDSNVQRLVENGGKPLTDEARSYFEPRFGTDFSGVRVHTGSEANEAARSINAKAFTLGSNIAFAKGNYDHESRAGKQLLAHELTHVVQNETGTQNPSRVYRQSDDSDLGDRIDYLTHSLNNPDYGSLTGQDLLDEIENARDELPSLATNRSAMDSLHHKLSEENALDVYENVCRMIFSTDVDPNEVVKAQESVNSGSEADDYRHPLYDLIYDQGREGEIELEWKHKMVETRINGTIVENIDQSEVAEAGLSEEVDRLKNETLDNIYEAYRIGESDIERSEEADLEQVTLVAEAKNEEGKAARGSASPHANDMTINILYPEDDSRYDVLHEFGHLIDDAHVSNVYSMSVKLHSVSIEGGSVTVIPGRGAFHDISGWKEYEDADSLVEGDDHGGLVENIRDPYAIENSENTDDSLQDRNNFRDRVKRVTKELVRRTINEGEINSSDVQDELDEEFRNSTSTTNASMPMPVPRVIETIRIAQATTHPWTDDQFSELDGHYGNRIFHQGYTASYPNSNWWSYVRDAREHRVSEYALRTPQEEFAEAYAHAIHPDYSICPPYRTFIESEFPDIPDDQLEGGESCG